MINAKLIKLMTGSILVISMSVGCSKAAAEPTATLLPTITPEPTLVPPEATRILPTNTSSPILLTATKTILLPSPTIETPTPIPLGFRSEGWGLEDAIPEKYSCHGENISPPLSWSDPPDGTQSFVIIMDDPDAAAVAGFTWDHWSLYNIPADYRSLPEGIPAQPELADGSRQGKTSWDTTQYGGPCPPAGRNHGYVFRLYAVDTLLDLEPGATKNEIFEAIQGHVLSKAIMTWYFPGE